jgi:hypothetical protein
VKPTTSLSQILVLYDDRPLSRQEFVARQLAHNAITGKDDAAILRDLWAEIEDVSLKYYAGLDDKILEQLADASLAALSEARLDYRLISFLFLPEEVDRLQEAFRRARETIPAEEVVILRITEFSRLIDALGKVQAAFNVHNGATALLLILDIFERHYEELRAGYWGEEGKPKHKGLVPLASVFGTDQVPAATAVLLGRVLDTMLAQGEIPKEDRGKALERMAHKYLTI